MTTVAQVLFQKGGNVINIDADASVFDAIKLMAERNIGAVTITDNGKLVGIFTERDYARKVILKGKTSPGTKVGAIMTGNPVCVAPEYTVEHCMALMTDKTIRHLPVLDGDLLVGIISIGDLVKCIIDEKEYIIDQLEHYIQGG